MIHSVIAIDIGVVTNHAIDHHSKPEKLKRY